MSKREPFVSNQDLWAEVPTEQTMPDLTREMGITKYPLMSAPMVRDRYESLIDSGDLIVRSELWEWIRKRMAELEESGSMADTTRMSAPDDWQREGMRRVLKHITRKP